MKPQEIYGKLFIALMEKGYYDPTEDYAKANVELLQSLNEESFEGVFYFKLKAYNLVSALSIKTSTSRMRLYVPLSGISGSKEFKKSLINSFLENVTSPNLRIDDEDIIFEYYLFAPYNTEQLITILNWFDGVIKLFVQQYQEAAKQQQEDK